MKQYVYYHIFIINFLILQIRSDNGVTAATLKIVVVAEQLQPEASGWFLDTIKDVSSRGPDWLQLEEAAVQLDRENPQDSFKTFCSTISLGTSLVLDLTWSPWTDLVEMLDNADIPVVNSELGEALPILEGLLQLLAFKNATDAVLIFEKESVMEHALYKILGSSVLRILALFDIASRVEQLRNMRPIPNYFLIIGTTQYLKDTYKMMVRTKLLTLPDRWILASTDMTAATLDISVLMDNTTIISLVPETNCWLQGLEMPCADELDNNQMNSIIMEKIIRKIVEVGLATNLQDFLAKPDCSGNHSETKSETSTMRRTFMTLLAKPGKDDKMLYNDMKKQGLYFKAEQMVSVGGSRGMTTAARWFSGEKFKPLSRANITSPRRFLRVGTAPAMPWTYVKLDEDGKPILDEKGEPIFEGYCIDLIAKLAEVMDFDYEIVKAMQFGRKLDNGTWDGLIGDLAKGDTDIAVAAIIMTSQREEVVDFVAPYFDQTGLSIVIRKPVRKTSLFKFMTVLRVEVWLSIVGALTLTAILLTILDKYSPYSSRNNKEAYPYPCREFTLKESLWFALTSFTPQGGGEAPKALSSRALVAAYWLFVVLMLATFTANLAAFLTVERMQTPVSSLEQLARQSRINYTVVEGGMAHKYFMNMKNAEDTLYRVWKEITLNASSDEVQYQVWDYPIREQYGHILLAINSSSPLQSTEEGFRKVDERLEADFAFIHDSSEIKYQVKKNCNLTIVGEVFGERPFAVAVQQGSRIQEELSRAILQLQKDRFLDSLIARYWNTSCEDSDNSEGITLDSLGGVFIATLFGLVLALITLVWEIFYYKRKENIERVTKKIAVATPGGLMQAFKGRGTEDKKQPKESVKTITFGDNFKAVKSKNNNKVSFINVEPKLQWNP